MSNASTRHASFRFVCYFLLYKVAAGKQRGFRDAIFLSFTGVVC
ncbi:hypothetical protein GBL_1208 [Geobacillus kaustophilus GBlys]|uniref:Uncharacterized protein n=1 Tax=Geobacillus kaustophilus GBlys TaxID=1337888 RepID=U2WQE0_GEOKU|nr:hypothetical protein GBL_1208 [Geobacillus kaustophilus GBlys]